MFTIAKIEFLHSLTLRVNSTELFDIHTIYYLYASVVVLYAVYYTCYLLSVANSSRFYDNIVLPVLLLPHTPFLYCTVLSPKKTELSHVIRYIGRHLINLCFVKVFNVAQCLHIFRSDKVDGKSLTSKASRTTNTVDVKFFVGGYVVANY